MAEPALPVAVAGDRVTTSLGELQFKAAALIAAEQSKPLPDNVVIDVLCETVRLVREFVDHAKRELDDDPNKLDLDLLAKFASGHGGRRTGALARAGLLRYEVTGRGWDELKRAGKSPPFCPGHVRIEDVVDRCADCGCCGVHTYDCDICPGVEITCNGAYEGECHVKNPTPAEEG